MQIAEVAYGASASERIKLLPVKAIADAEPTTRLVQGFPGIEVAARLGADIILNAWSVEVVDEDAAAIVRNAIGGGATVIGAAGNFPDERRQHPAAFADAIGVAGLGTDNTKLPQSNYGQFVDLAAPAAALASFDSTDVTGWREESGTSFSAALVAGVAALMHQANPKLTPYDVRACLLNTSAAHRGILPRYRGKLGAGRLNATAAIACARDYDQPQRAKRGADVRLSKPRGVLQVQGRDHPAWRIETDGEFDGIEFELGPRNAQASGRFVFEATDGTILGTLSLDAPDGQLHIAASSAIVRFDADRRSRRARASLSYAARSIDLSAKYCSGTVELDAPTIIEDGSGEAPYAFDSDCKWQIKAPPGQVVRWTFEAIDTEPFVDRVYLFHGNSTANPIMAIYTGTEIPAPLITWGNEALVWFITSDTDQRQGFRARVEFIDPPPRDPPGP